MRFRLTFLLHITPVILWLFLFGCGVSLIPTSIKPSINVTLLPRLDRIFGHSIAWFTHDADTPILNLLAAVPYTIHPILPLFYLATFCALMPKKSHHHLLRFVLAFGLMNLAAVCTHLIFPTSPPWYFLKYGTKAASYATKGDPAILAKLDERYNMLLYHRMYAEGGKVVFGAWPSLHAAWPYLMARFRPVVPYRAVRIWQWCYMVLVWWAAVWLQHHYFVDVLGGVLYAEVAYRVAGREKEMQGLPVYVKMEKDGKDADGVVYVVR